MSDFDKDFQEGPDFDSDFGEGGSFTGNVADTLFGHTSTIGKSPLGSLARTMSAYGQGVNEDWGAGSATVSKETDDWMKKHGVYNDYQNNKTGFFKGLNEQFIRPTIYAALTAGKLAHAGFAGIQAGGEQAAEELDLQGKNLQGMSHTPYGPENVLGYGLRAGGEILSGFMQGAGMELPGMFPHVATAGRAKAVIGEGEAGFFNTREVTPNNLVNRANAADVSGVPMKPVEPPTFDIHDIARRISPDTYAEVDRLKDVQDNLRMSKSYLESNLGRGYKEDLATKAKLADIPDQLTGVDEQLRDLIPKQQQARMTAEELINSDSKEGAAFRDWVTAERLKATMRIDELTPEMLDSESHAEILVPSPSERAQTAKKLGQATPIAGEKAAVSEAPTASERPSTNESHTDVQGAIDAKLSPQPELQGSEASSQNTTSPGSFTINEEDAFSGSSGLANKSTPGTGPIKTSQFAQRIEDEARDNGLLNDKESFGVLPQARQLNLKEQAAETAKLIEKDYEGTKGMIFDGAPIPPDIHPTSLLVGLKLHAIEIGDIETIQRLATSENIASTVREEARSLRILREDSTAAQEDPVKLIKNANDTRIAESDKGHMGKLKEDIMKEAENSIDTFQSDWQSFVSSLECDY